LPLLEKLLEDSPTQTRCDAVIWDSAVRHLHYPAQAIGARTNVIIDTCENCSLNWLD